MPRFDWSPALKYVNHTQEGGAGGVGFAEFLEVLSDAAEAYDAIKVCWWFNPCCLQR